jgi:hypothetical protein
MIFVISADAVGRFPAVGKFLHALSKSKSKSKSKKHRDNHSKVDLVFDFDADFDEKAEG